jgi:hypothetical protein
MTECVFPLSICYFKLTSNFTCTPVSVSNTKIEEGHTTQWPKEKRTSNDLQNITQETKDQAKITLLKTSVTQ